ncbi:transcription elongation factor GreA [Limosilactobacillus secaliphilus]|uniref:Transcription elongation factor GreA n=1 Tax=Limosilactobacillus secaliphilus TaxID=396268 RepID=A0A0R2I043_9LACO|nr:transcription elongation factor GreA [Limosilactobacillus secaliphilus]KRN58514.1 transcription elongation factor GreB [Limosilactobacillus secaliphilus]
MRKIYYQKMTPTGYQQIKDQIAALQKERPTRIARLKAARALGDLSENTEYSTAKRELRHLESRLRYLNKQITYAQVIKNDQSDQIDLGSTVTIEFDDDHSQATYIVVGKHEADLAQNKLAFDSPLGQALMGQSAGSTVAVQSPNGSYNVTIKKVK